MDDAYAAAVASIDRAIALCDRMRADIAAQRRDTDRFLYTVAIRGARQMRHRAARKAGIR